MTKITTSQTNFTAGEISPRLYGHTDTTVYSNGLETATNCVITPHGPIKRRNGTKFISEAKSVEATGNAARVRLLRFQFSASDAFIIELGDPNTGSPYMRFYQNGGQVLETADTITGITKASPAVVTTSGAHGFSTGDNVYITGVVGMTEINRPNKAYQVGSTTSTTFEVLEIGGANINSSAYTTYSSAGSAEKIYEITSPYDLADIDNVSYVQFGNSIYLAHPDYAPRKLTRTATTDWSIETISFSPEPTVELGYAPDTTCTPAATTGTGVNFTAGTGTWLQGDVGRQIVNNTDGETGKAIITSITSNTVAVCDIVTDFTDTNAIASGDWKLDLSPIGELEFSGAAAGSIVTVTANYPVSAKGDKIAISGISKATTAVITTSSAHGLSAGVQVFISDVEGMTEINGRTLTAKSVTSTTLTMTDGSGTNFNSSNFTTYSTGGNIQDVFTDIKQDTFRSTDVGLYILANDGVLKINEYVSATEVKCEVLKALSSRDNSENWTLEEPDWTASRGFPRAVGLFQERLVFGGTTSKPTTLYFSETGIFEGMGVGSLDSDAIIVDVSSREVNQINWLSNSRDFVVGTAGSELTIAAPSASTGLSASNIEIQTRTYHGSLSQYPVNVGTETLFIQGSGRKVRTFRYDFNLDGYTGEDLNFFAEHLTEGGIKEISYTQEPDTVIYAVTNNGDLLVGTYVREQKILGWTKYTTTGNFENVQVISNGTTDEVWVSVNRTVNSNTYRYIELFDDGTGEDRLDGYSDSYLTYSSFTAITGITKANPAVVTSTAHGLSDGDRVKLIDVGGMTEVESMSFLVANKTANTFELTDLQGNNIDSSAYTAYTSGGEAHKLIQSVTGLDHLEGETVEVKVDGSVTANLTVSSGAITLTDWNYEVTVGIPYTTTLKTLKKEFDIGRGTMQGQKSRYIRPVLRLYKSTLPLVDGNFMPARSGNDEMDEAVPLFSGDQEFGMLNWADSTQMTISVATPLPLTLSGIFGSFEGNIK